MSLSKRFTGNFSLESIDSGLALTMSNTGAVVIDGNLTISGTTTTVDSVELTVVDNTITLNSGEVGAGVTLGTAGIEIDRGSSTNAFIIFDESDDTWKLDPGTGVPVAIAFSGGTGIANVIEDLTPQLGGNLDVNGKTITSAAGGDIIIAADTTGVVKVDQELTLLEQAAPPALASYSKLYANTAGAGGSGLYYVNNSDSDELVSRKKAMVFGLIF